MKSWGALLGICLIAALVVPTSAAADDPLSGRAARDLSERIVATVFRHSEKLDTTSFHGCDRLSPRRVSCRFKGIGQTSRTRIDCYYRVAVGLRRGQPVGRLAVLRCHGRAFEVLSRKRARKAMLRVANEWSEPEPVNLTLKRLGRLSIRGVAIWFEDRTEPNPVLCKLKLLAHRLPARKMSLTTTGPDCQPVKLGL
jgi:hypothetical protein